MLKIRLFCANGMSTSLLVKKMEDAAKEKGKEEDFHLFPHAFCFVLCMHRNFPKETQLDAKREENV